MTRCRHGFDPRTCAFCEPEKAQKIRHVAIGFPCRHRGCSAEPNAPCTRNGKPIKRLHQVRWNDAYTHVNALAKMQDLNKRYGVEH